MKLKGIIGQNFQEALGKLNGQTLPVKAAFKLKDIVKKVEEELKKFNDVRVATVKKYASKDEKGEPAANADGSLKLEGEALTEFLKEFDELIDIELPELGALNVADLGEKAEISAGDLAALEPILKS